MYIKYCKGNNRCIKKKYDINHSSLNFSSYRSTTGLRMSVGEIFSTLFILFH